MRALSVLLTLLLCTPAFAASPAFAPRAASMVAGNIQALKINDVLQMKVKNIKDFEEAKIEGLGVGDDVELRKIAADKLEVKRLATGQVGVMQVQ